MSSGPSSSPSADAPSSPGRRRLSWIARNWQYVMLALVPVALVAEWTHASATVVFLVSGLAVVPLAGIMGHATEQLADRWGPGVGGLLNASFGNAAELILAFVALRSGHFDIVRASITGSIIGNVLVVLGLAALIGGRNREGQSFSSTAATGGASMLLISVSALLAPAILLSEVRLGKDAMANLSFWLSAILLVTYALGLLFSLKTHRHLYGADGPHDQASGPGHGEEPIWRPLAALIGATVGVAVMSEFLVGAVDHAMADLHMNQVFVGVVVLAIIGNAAEHSTAVLMAMRDRMDIAVTICLESSKQVALFVAPVLILTSGLVAGQVMTVEFSGIEIASMFLAVLILNFVIADGRTNWLEGVQLLALYLVLAVVLYFIPAAGVTS